MIVTLNSFSSITDLHSTGLLQEGGGNESVLQIIKPRRYLLQCIGENFQAGVERTGKKFLDGEITNLVNILDRS